MKENFSRSTVTVLFSYFFQSINYNNVVDTKQIYFSPTFSKSWMKISDNIAGVLGDPQYY